MTAPQRLQIKLYIRQGSLNQETLISQFHSWIQQDLLDEVAIDVADYSHVSGGPGILLITHEADYAFDEVGGTGLRYMRKKQMPATMQEALWQSYEQVAKAASRLERETSGAVEFDLTRAEITVLDRRLYPNTSGSEAALLTPIMRFFASVFSTNSITCSRTVEDVRYPLVLSVSASHTLSLDHVLNALGANLVPVPSY